MWSLLKIHPHIYNSANICIGFLIPDASLFPALVLMAIFLLLFQRIRSHWAAPVEEGTCVRTAMASVGMRSVSVNLTITGEPLGVVGTTSMHIIGLAFSLVSVKAATASNVNYFKKTMLKLQSRAALTEGDQLMSSPPF